MKGESFTYIFKEINIKLNDISTLLYVLCI